MDSQTKHLSFGNLSIVNNKPMTMIAPKITASIVDFEIPQIWGSTMDQSAFRNSSYSEDSPLDARNSGAPRYVLNGVTHGDEQRKSRSMPTELHDSLSEPHSRSLNPFAVPFQPRQQQSEQVYNDNINYQSAPIQPFPFTTQPLPAQRSPHEAPSLSADIPKAQSVSLWITGLPLTSTVASVLGPIRGCGKIFSLEVLAPAPGRGRATSAARLSFWSVAGKDRFQRLAARGGFAFGSGARRRPRVGHSSYRIPERAGGDDDEGKGPSRVLHIAGPAAVVNRASVEALLARYFEWATDCVVDHGRGAGRGDDEEGEDEEEEEAWIEYRFASYRAQASRAWDVFDNIRRGVGRPRASDEDCDLLRRVRTWWGVDPCA